MSGRVEVIAVEAVGEVSHGDALGPVLSLAAERAGAAIEPRDVVVISQKVVSKAEGRLRDLRSIQPGGPARELAAELGKDPRFVQLVLDESRSVIRAERGVLIVETNAGWVCANAGIDTSNVPGEDVVALLPEDADASARRIRDELRDFDRLAPAVVIADSFGRPWRMGQTDVAIGCAGLVAVDDWQGREDAHGRPLSATVVAIADEVAAAADLVRDKAAQAPAAVVRGLGRYVTLRNGPGAAPLRRAESEDLFR